MTPDATARGGAATPDATARALLARHAQAQDLFGARVRAVREDQWDTGTPCAEWSVRDLVNHLVSEQLWAPSLVRDGCMIEEVGDTFEGDLLGPDPAASWDTAARSAREAFAAPGALDRTVHLSYGDTPAVAYCGQMVADLVVHTWDLSRAIGADERLPDALVSFTTDEITPYAGELEKTGLFEAAVAPPAGADAQTTLLCLLGRRP
ncbi:MULTISPECIES: TIGR03086 family metal-binding protein [Streptomyces]|nr:MULTISPECIES: TIGR03086 family metal-binding protein [Streptomyces]MDX2554776.1 TIGR03086 family metal-binding protein [Streptomyces stelliscabiei]MDX2610819.1 TIGR03086 family metal-binding protein [Streptomyces stelliscabiei]MDX2639112.1 TIGR03086 family metal-binding protein [Streptomyces stelliscabiei]MDX2662055.1 TIGR03086 family metal-binding protein [Streptomyces stelliscabiei]MDX2712530.1 TIGR03086 family metal-binding protein [Streptomyces stelliscabiei]